MILNQHWNPGLSNPGTMFSPECHEAPQIERVTASPSQCLLTTIVFGEEGGRDVTAQRITSAAVGLLRKLPFEVIQALQGLGHVLELKEAAGQAEMCLQMAWVQGDGLEAVPQGIVVVTIPEKTGEYGLEVGPHGKQGIPTQSPLPVATPAHLRQNSESGYLGIRGLLAQPRPHSPGGRVC